MRIVGGALRGKKLLWESNDTTRPTGDRIKENVFNILCAGGIEFAGARVLDLFAGSGQLGIECLSRGAGRVVFNDKSADSVAIISKNLAETPKSMQKCATVLNLDYLSALSRLKSQQFDIIFIDPPFKEIETVKTAVETIKDGGLLAKNGVIIVENECETLEFGGFDVDFRAYGRTKIYILRGHNE
jgi:16S rRNA (guanine(966)-N(2))-methyltransferase RsmD